MAILTRADIDSIIAERLDSEPGFRERLITDPRATVAEIAGTPLPAMVTIEVHQESLTQIHLVIPASPATGEITEDDLELVAGGTCWADSCTSGP
jgi:hypothetical protein